MTSPTAVRSREQIVREYELDAPPERVWRAITIPAFREHWLPGRDLADPDPVAETPGEEVRYRLRDDTPPFLESDVTFRLRPGRDGRTLLRIVQTLTDARLSSQAPPAANANGPVRMQAA